MNPWDAQSARIYGTEGVYQTLYSGERGGMQRHGVCVETYPDIANTLTARADGSPNPDKGQGANIVCFGISAHESNAMRSPNPESGCYVAETARTLDGEGGNPGCNQGGIAVCYDARGNGSGEISPTIAGDHESRVTDYTTVCCIGNVQADNTGLHEVAPALSCMHDQQAVLCPDKPAVRWKVRRLTPTECERLQGYPSSRKVDVSKMTKDEYIAWNLAERNIIADTESGKVYGTRGSGGVAYETPKELKGTLVNGYHVVSIRNGTTKLACRVHRIIWIAANGIIPDGFVVDHINNNKTDNRISNLQLLTPAQNSTKASMDGLYHKGLDNKATKLDPKMKDEVAFFYTVSDLSQRELADVYGVSKSRINQIIKEVGWTDIGDYVDSKGNKKKTSDSARYRALGNSIALPSWFWLLSRLKPYCRAGTMASLFDGIGGFPLCWNAIGGETLWCSEIDEFCKAVTTKHFGDEDKGIAGDWKDYLPGIFGEGAEAL